MTYIKAVRNALPGETVFNNRSHDPVLPRSVFWRGIVIEITSKIEDAYLSKVRDFLNSLFEIYGTLYKSPGEKERAEFHSFRREYFKLAAQIFVDREKLWGFDLSLDEISEDFYKLFEIDAMFASGGLREARSIVEIIAFARKKNLVIEVMIEHFVNICSLALSADDISDLRAPLNAFADTIGAPQKRNREVFKELYQWRNEAAHSPDIEQFPSFADLESTLDVVDEFFGLLNSVMLLTLHKIRHAVGQPTLMMSQSMVKKKHHYGGSTPFLEFSFSDDRRPEVVQIISRGASFLLGFSKDGSLVDVLDCRHALPGDEAIARQVSESQDSVEPISVVDDFCRIVCRDAGFELHVCTSRDTPNWAVGAGSANRFLFVGSSDVRFLPSSI
ncbi:hypothetical protein [Corynebacterium suicordis]|uniref:Apea-like HEPN domain-containing protein n=1 Tax=Corynebacterium suicordis DSM 45110 TaxID=1121369 RepID=A0ABR9ZL52_9CORY|nr:hypothetical protein [Corynebacterium suicordis]MBF4553347.1 hypothetical protein [Corynebacterium suicordis DSM 45110]MDR6277680.1 hypothetical protein [Corynebacterium suicordis]